MAKKVVIVGGGLAGLSATIEAAEAGAEVTLLEKEANVGGNSAKASSGINGCATAVQERMGIKDSFDLCFADTMTAGDNANNRDLVDTLIHNSRAAVEWLQGKHVNLDDVNLCGGHSVPRTHWIPSPKEGKPLPVGVAIIRALKAHIDELIKLDKPIKIVTGAKVHDLIYDAETKTVTGVIVDLPTFPGQKSEIAADAVILTSGGFGSDRGDAEDSLMKEFAAAKLQYATTNGAFAQGEGMKMARRIDAKLIDMDKVQIHPTAFIDPKNPAENTKFLAAEALRGKGAILLNQKGKRFCNELGRRDYVTEKINEHCDVMTEANGARVAWMLMDERAVEAFGRPAFNFYHKIKGFFERFDTLDALLKYTKWDKSTFEATILAYSFAASGRAPDQHGRKNFLTPFEHMLVADEGEMLPVYVARITPAVHYTMGGAAIDTNARVLHKDGGVINGLYAAGEVSGGVHGHNRLAGNSLLECVVFGRIAGQQQSTVKGEL